MLRGTLTSIPEANKAGHRESHSRPSSLLQKEPHVSWARVLCSDLGGGGGGCGLHLAAPYSTQAAGWHGSLQKQTLLTVTGLQGKL